MKLYQIDYRRLVLLILPTFLRKSRIFAFLSALVFGISEMHAKFLKRRDADLLRIKRNGQVCYLRGMLNDELDPGRRRITITDGYTDGSWVFAYKEGDAYQLLLEESGTIIYSEGLMITNTAFFYVSVPWKSGDENRNNRLRNYLDNYKLLSKKYVINYE